MKIEGLRSNRKDLDRVDVVIQLVYFKNQQKGRKL